MQRLADERERQAAERESHREQLNAARERWQSERDVAYEAGVKAETLRTRINSLRESETRNVEQLSAMDARLAELEEALSATEQPLAEARAQLDERLDEKDWPKTGLTNVDRRAARRAAGGAPRAGAVAGAGAGGRGDG